MLELYELTAEVKDEQGRTLMKGLSAKVCMLHINLLCLFHTAHLLSTAMMRQQHIFQQIVILIEIHRHIAAWLVLVCC